MEELKFSRKIQYYSASAMLTSFSAGAGGATPPALTNLKWLNSRRLTIWAGCDFPEFLPKQVENIKDPYARKLASRIERIPVRFFHSLFKMCVFFLLVGVKLISVVFDVFEVLESMGVKSVLFVEMGLC